MRRRIVEVNKAEVRRFRPETVKAQPLEPTQAGALAATLGERAIARQLASGRRAYELLIIDDPIRPDRAKPPLSRTCARAEPHGR